MKIYSIDTECFMIDGGAMFGVVPKAIWKKRYPCNENNLCNNAIRNLLVVTDDRRILIDTGIGTRMPESFLKYQYINGNDTLLGSLKKHGYTPEDITDLIFTHLHWDHSGGALINDKDGNPKPQFPNAKMWVSRQQWEWANNSNLREEAAYPEHLIKPLNTFGKLNFIEEDTELYPGIELRLHNGHTKGLLIPVIKANKATVVYAGDLIPSTANIPPIYLSAYDIYPMDAIDEKVRILKEITENNYVVIFQHDINVEAATIEETPKGYKVKEILKIEDVN